MKPMAHCPGCGAENTWVERALTDDEKNRATSILMLTPPTGVYVCRMYNCSKCGHECSHTAPIRNSVLFPFDNTEAA